MKFWQEKRYDMEYRSFPLTTKQRNVYCQLVECLLGSLLGSLLGYLLGACWVLLGYLLGQGTKKSELWGNCMTTMG